MRKLDTSTLGAIKVDVDALATRARVVREALIGAMECDPDERVSRYARWVAENASPVSLASLGRKLR